MVNDIINTKAWIDEYKSSFLPPVCNKLMHNQQLIIMFIGGPNNRKDYHIEEGEELFYQLVGDMCLKIVENGKHKDIVIKEGEFFLLPARIPHSPQRTANSVGLVIERLRTSDEMDGVRYFVQPDTTQTLYEKWFHCHDLGSQLIPLIKEFFASDEYKTNIPKDNVCESIPFELNETLINDDKHGPFNLMNRIENIDKNLICLTPAELKLQFDITIMKKGVHKLKNSDGNNVWLWQLKGKSSIKMNDNKSVEFNENDSLLLETNLSDSQSNGVVVVINDDSAYMMSVIQNPKLK